MYCLHARTFGVVEHSVAARVQYMRVSIYPGTLVVSQIILVTKSRVVLRLTLALLTALYVQECLKPYCQGLRRTPYSARMAFEHL